MWRNGRRTSLRRRCFSPLLLRLSPSDSDCWIGWNVSFLLPIALPLSLPSSHSFAFARRTWHGMAWHGYRISPVPSFVRSFFRSRLRSPTIASIWHFMGRTCSLATEGGRAREEEEEAQTLTAFQTLHALSLALLLRRAADIIVRFFSGRYVTEQRTESRRRDICPRRKKGSSKYRRISDRSRCDRASH